MPSHKLQRKAAYRIEDGTRPGPVPSGFALCDGTQAASRRAAATPRADWLGGSARAGPFILPSLVTGPQAARLRVPASRMRCLQRCQTGSASAARAARWRQDICTMDGKFMVHPKSTAAAHCQSHPMHGWDRSNDCRTMPDWYCSREIVHRVSGVGTATTQTADDRAHPHA